MHEGEDDGNAHDEHEHRMRMTKSNITIIMKIHNDDDDGGDVDVVELKTKIVGHRTSRHFDPIFHRCDIRSARSNEC